MSKFAKTGMWRCRDGNVRTVSAVAPSWAHQEHPLEGYENGGEGSLPFRTWDMDGRHIPGKETGHDLIEHLSDDIADPRTWQPPVQLKEGVWEFDDGSRGVVRAKQHGVPFEVYFLDGDKVGWCCVYKKDGSANHLYGGWPKVTRFIGPLPTGEGK